MSVVTTFTQEQVIQRAVQEIQSELAACQPKVVLYFASSSYNPQEIAHNMEQAFPGATVFGCTTSGELISGKMSKNSIVAMGFTSDIIGDINIQIVQKISTEDHVQEVFKGFEDYYHTPALELDPEKYVGIVICDGLTKAEEKIIDSIGNLTNVTFIGGSAGDDLKFASTYVFANGQAYSNAALLALLKPISKFDFIKTQSFNPTNKALVATKVDEANRVVIEFDHKPAVEAYAEAIGHSVDSVGNGFMSHPLGLMIDDEPYVRSPQQVNDGAITFYCNVKEGMEMSVLESTDIIADTTAVIEEKQAEVGSIKAIVNFNCILRTLQLDSQGTSEQYGKIFTHIPTIGFSTYGEAYIGHINQTATMLIFF
ncbi:FIST signal transduction protein [Pelosinus sp. sgz500959]|uniref:FIST signal transduction protein n=1 Tax=Pelosinus sp. sgz500959 TaxID=3242472 RepID=UPI00366AC343